TRQVAASDSTELGGQSLADYYSAKGESPGRWRGQGLSSLGRLASGDTVTEDHMRALFGEGRHPCADVIEDEVLEAEIRAGATEKQAATRSLAASKLGAAFASYDDKPSEFIVQVTRAYRAYNQEHGLPRDAAVPDEVRADIRTRVGRETFGATYDREPLDDRELAAHIARSSRPPRQPVAGYDVTFSPVKSVSTFWAVAPREISQEIEAAHQAAVEDAMDWIERTVSYTRRGKAGVRQVDIKGLLMAQFTHRDSRAGDPDLHTHVAISNKVQALDGSWLALDGQPLHQALVSASERYNTRLEAEVQDRLGVSFVEREDHTRGAKRAVREIDGVSPELMAAWSSRRVQIDARRAELTAEFRNIHGRPPTPKEAIALAQQATLETREAKHEPRSLAEQRQHWAAQAEEVLGADGLETMLATVRSTLGPEPRDLTGAERDDLAARALRTVEASRARWQMVHVRAEVERRVRGLGLSKDALDDVVEDCVSRALGPDRSVSLQRPETLEVPAELRRADGSSQYHRAHSTLYSSERVLAAEEKILAAAQRYDGRTIDDAKVAVALLEAAANGTALNTGQAAMVTAMATSGARVQLGLAPAGSGKTTAMRALSSAWQDAGGTVIGLAPSAVASTELGTSIGTDADTLSKLVWHLRNPEGTPKWMRAINERTLVIIDEAGMASTPDLAAAIDYVTSRGGSVRLIGDDQQLAAVGAGGILRDIASEVGAVSLSELHRFTNPAEAEATLALREGRTEALGYYLDNGRVRVSADTDSVLAEVFQAWKRDRDAGVDALMLAATNVDVDALNELARAYRLGDNTEDQTTVTLRAGTHASAGDQIITRRNDRRLLVTQTHWVKNGDRFTVGTVHSDGSLTAVHDGTSRSVHLPADYVREHVDLGYCTTYHGAQGTTVDATHCALNGSESRQLLYVGMSRGRHANHVYVPVSGDGDDHANIHPDTVNPRTAVDVLEQVLQRDDAPRSARTEVRDSADPALQLHATAGRYADAIDLAALVAIGQERVAEITEEAERLLPGLTGCPAWDTLLGHLCRIDAETNGAALSRLDAAIKQRDLGSAADPAAVLDWRLDSNTSRSAGTGPLPWLAAPPTVDDPAWSTYLAALSEEVTEHARDLRTRVRDGADLPAWALGLQHDPELVADLTVWRSALGIEDPHSPTGPRRPSARHRRHQEWLDSRVSEARSGSAAPSQTWDAVLVGTRVVEDPHWVALSQRLDRESVAGRDIPKLLTQALQRGPLPDDHPAAALWSRLTEILPTLPAPTRPAPPWASVITDVLGDDLASAVTTSSAWAHIVDALEAGATDGHRPEAVLRSALSFLEDDAADAASAGGLGARLLGNVRSVLDADSSPITPPAEQDYFDPETAEYTPVWDETPQAPDVETRHEDSEPPEDLAAAFPLGGTSRDRILELTSASADYYREALEGSTAEAYLRRRTGEADLDRYVIGYAPAGWTGLVDHLRETSAATDTELVDAGLAKWSKHGTLYDVFRDRLVFGLHDIHGDLVGYVGRRAPGTDDGPKYLNTPETDVFHKRAVLFGLHEGRTHLDDGATPVRVEGTLDAIAITAASNGRLVGVAPLGTALSATQAEHLTAAANADRRVLVAPDVDEAGLAAAERDYWKLVDLGADPRILPIPGGDAAEAWQDQPEVLTTVTAVADAAPPLASTVIDRHLDRHTSDLDEGWIHARVNAARAVAPVIASTPLPQWEQHVEDVAARLGDDDAKDLIWTEVIAAAIPWNPLVEDEQTRAEEEITTVRRSLAEISADLEAIQADQGPRRDAIAALSEALSRRLDAREEQPRSTRRDRGRGQDRPARPGPSRS
ncbi:MobF family relaxase, partial [Marihabitans asiaticum]